MFTLHTLVISYNGKEISFPEGSMMTLSALVSGLRAAGVEFSILSITPCYKRGW